MTCSVAIVLAFSAQQEAVQSVMLADRVNAIPAPGEHFVDVTLMRDIENETVLGRVEHPMQGNGKLHDAKIGSEVATSLTERFDQSPADFFREFGEFLQRQGFEIGGRVDGREFGVHGV
jgi:hypothetical protein